MEAPLSPELTLELTRRAKQQIRSRMRALRSGHPPSALAARSAKLVERLLAMAELSDARSVATFWPMVDRAEPDLRPLDAQLRSRATRLYYPFMDPKPGGGFVTGFRLTETSGDLRERGNGFLEPSPAASIAQPGDVDLVLVPALAADARGHRIGYGAGYYDATLSDVAPPARTIITLFDFQLLAELPSEPHDQACDWLVTDLRTARASGTF